MVSIYASKKIKARIIHCRTNRVPAVRSSTIDTAAWLQCDLGQIWRQVAMLKYDKMRKMTHFGWGTDGFQGVKGPLLADPWCKRHQMAFGWTPEAKAQVVSFPPRPHIPSTRFSWQLASLYSCVWPRATGCYRATRWLAPAPINPEYRGPQCHSGPRHNHLQVQGPVGIA